MTYFGKEGRAVPEPEPPLRVFTFNTWGGKERRIEADGIVFGPAHVQFWRNPPGEASSLLVEAVTNANANNLREEKP